MRKKQQEEKRRASTRTLIGVKEITGFSLVTYEHGELVMFLDKPTNISVLSEASVRARLYALMTVLQGMAIPEAAAGRGRKPCDTPTAGTVYGAPGQHPD